MDDSDGTRVASAIYRALFNPEFQIHSDDPDEQTWNINMEVIPYALQMVAQEMRAEGLPASRWAQYIHYGI